MAGDGVVIRPMSIEDAEGFNRVVGVVARERRYLRFSDAFPMDTSLAFLRDGLAAGNVHLAAVLGNKVVGWCDICRHTLETEAHAGVLGIGLLPDYRGQGLGKALLEAAVAAAEERDLRRIELTVFADNLRAIALYEKTGFVREGVMRAARYLGPDDYRDVVLMARLDPRIVAAR
jgi:RimJ/RimL family protein N-acetyltransferase